MEGRGRLYRSVTPLFNSNFFFYASDASSYFTRYTHGVSTYDTLNRTVYGFTARRHRAASYAYISIRVVYSRLFIRLSFNCPISARRVCNGTSRGYFALGSKVRTTMEMRTRIIACPDVPLPSDTAGLAEERVFEIHLSLSLEPS